LVLNVVSTSASAWKTTAIFSENNNLVESISLLIEVKSKFAPTSAKTHSSKVVIKPPLPIS
jgi:hypothetical protein